MHAYIMPHNLSQPQMRPWVGHILDIVLLVFIVKSRSSFLPCLRNTLFSSLPNLSLSIAFTSKTRVFLAPVYHFMLLKSTFESVFYLSSCPSCCNSTIHSSQPLQAYSTITLNPHTPNQFPPSKNGKSRHH